MTEIDLAVKSNQRAFIAGKTGSGKTFFARYLLQSAKRLVVLDPKGMLTREEDPGWNLTDWSAKGRKLLMSGEPCRLRVPYPQDGDWSSFVKDVFEARNVTLYIDEMYGVVSPGKTPPVLEWLVACWTRGRQLGVGVIVATQRPMWVPLFAMSEADWFFIFRLSLEEDRKRLASFMGPSAMYPIPDEFGYLSYSVRWPAPIYTPQLNVRRRRPAPAKQSGKPQGKVRP